MNLLDIPFYLIFAACLTYVLITRGYYMLTILYNLFQRFEDQQRQENQDVEMILHSRFTIPISVILHHQQNEGELMRTLQSLVTQHYPEFEIIVVIDDHESQLSDTLINQYQLRQVCHLFSKIIPTRQVHTIYRSEKIQQLMVVVKDPDTEADALNVGINLARFRYFLPLPAGIVLKEDALLNLIRPALINPKEILAVSAPIALKPYFHIPTTASKWQHWLQLMKQRLWIALQTLEQLRHTLMHRFSWRQRRLVVGGLGGGFGDLEIVLWRKDMLLQLGGFSNGGAMDASLRLYEHCIRQALPCQLCGITEAVAWQSPAEDLYRFSSERQQAWQMLRWTLHKHRNWILNWTHDREYRRDYGPLGVIMLPILALEANLGPWLEVAAFTLVPIGCLCGAIPWSAFFWLITFYIGTSLFMSLLALHGLVRSQKTLKVAELWMLILAGCLDYLGFQQLCKLVKLTPAKSP